MPGVPEQTLALQPGNFAVQEKGFTRALRNGGAEKIELVEMELKLCWSKAPVENWSLTPVL